jgi:hypothetical protein
MYPIGTIHHVSTMYPPSPIILQGARRIGRGRGLPGRKRLREEGPSLVLVRRGIDRHWPPPKSLTDDTYIPYWVPVPAERIGFRHVQGGTSSSVRYDKGNNTRFVERPMHWVVVADMQNVTRIWPGVVNRQVDVTRI